MKNGKLMDGKRKCSESKKLEICEWSRNRNVRLKVRMGKEEPMIFLSSAYCQFISLSNHREKGGEMYRKVKIESEREARKNQSFNFYLILSPRLRSNVISFGQSVSVCPSAQYI